MLVMRGHQQVDIAEYYKESPQRINYIVRTHGLGRNECNLSRVKQLQKESIKQILDNEHEMVSRVADKALKKLDVMLDNVADDDIKAIVPVTAVRDRTFTQRRTLEGNAAEIKDYGDINLSLTKINQQINQYKIDNNMDVDAIDTEVEE